MRITAGFVKAAMAEQRARHSGDVVAIALTDRRMLRHMLHVAQLGENKRLYRKWLNQATRETRRVLGWSWWAHVRVAWRRRP